MAARQFVIMCFVILVATAIRTQYIDAGETELFRTTPVFGVGQGPTAIVSCDLNKDGIQDVVTANQTFNDIAVLLSDGMGGFRPQVRFGVGGSPRDLECVDLDGDGNLDVVTVNSNSTASILRGNGDGTFMVGALSVSVISAPLSLAVGLLLRHRLSEHS